MNQILCQKKNYAKRGCQTAKMSVFIDEHLAVFAVKLQTQRGTVLQTEVPWFAWQGVGFAAGSHLEEETVTAGHQRGDG